MVYNMMQELMENCFNPESTQNEVELISVLEIIGGICTLNWI
jgi:hypothetical protein